MSRNLFALERPRRISIAIPGYDGIALMKAKAQRAAGKKARLLRTEVTSSDQLGVTANTKAVIDDETASVELEQLNQLTSSILSKSVMTDLMLAFELPIAGVTASK